MCDEWVVADVTKHNLARLIAAQQALSAAIARVESPESAKPPPPPAGMRWLVPPRHALTPNHVGDARPVEVTLARFLLWRALLTHRQPTTQSLVRAHGLLRGLAIKRLAQIRRGKAETPPLKPDAPGVPAMTARSAVSRAATQTRAEGDLNPGDVSFENGELSPDDAAFLDELDYYDVWGDATGVPVDEMMDATGQNLAPDEERAIGATLSWDRLISNLTTIFPSDLQIAQAIDAAWNSNVIEWAGQSAFDAAGLAGTFDIRDPWFLDYLREQSGFWITGIDESTRLIVSQTLWDMLGGNADFWAPAGSRGPDTIARWLQRWSNVYENDLADMSAYRALMIAYTETARAETFGTFVSLWQSGARQKVWIANPGACVYCVTNVEEGPINLTAQFPTGHAAPPAHPLCCHPDTLVCGAPVVAGSERWYEGELVEVRTVGGYFLSVTPNHPILTSKGWIAAGLLKEGDDVLCGTLREHPLADDGEHNHHVPTLIQKVAQSAGGALDMTTSRMKGSAKDFHGDGRDGEVSVIRANRLLQHRLDAALTQPYVKELLGGRDAALALFSGLGQGTQTLERTVGASHRFTRRFGKMLALFGAAEVVHHADCFAHRTQRYATRRQSILDSNARDAISLADARGRLSFSVRRRHGVNVGIGCGLHIGANSDARTVQNRRDGIAAHTVGSCQFAHGLARSISGDDLGVWQPTLLVSSGSCHSSTLQSVIEDGFRHLKPVHYGVERFSGKVRLDHLRRRFHTLVARLDASFAQTVGDDRLADTESLTDSMLRLTSEIHADHLVSVNRRSYAGHVYNLQTTAGWYLASGIPATGDANGNITPNSPSGIVSHNCRCAISAYVPDTFRPDDWRPRPAGVLEGLLGSWDGAAWPATDLSFLDDVELPGIDLAARPSVTRSQRVTPKRWSVPPHPLSRDAFLALGDALAPALENAGRAWLAALSLDLPRDVEGVSALTKRLRTLPQERVRAADSAYLRRLRQAIERASATR